jgi:hypothetical protein
VEFLAGGAGFANAALVLPLHDAPRVEAFVKKRCAEEAAKKEVRPLGAFKVDAHGCSMVFDTHAFPLPLGFPRVPIAVTVADGRLTGTVGAGSSAPQQRPPRNVAALDEAVTMLFFGHDLALGPHVGAGAFFRDAIPLFGGRVAAAVEAWNYASAHLSEVLVRARVTDEGADFTLDLASFAGDPEPARAAYRATLAQRFAGNEAGYRTALAALERRFPGTRGARRAAEVRAGAPSFGAGVALFATLGMLGGDSGKKR